MGGEGEKLTVRGMSHVFLPAVCRSFLRCFGSFRCASVASGNRGLHVRGQRAPAIPRNTNLPPRRLPSSNQPLFVLPVVDSGRRKTQKCSFDIFFSPATSVRYVECRCSAGVKLPHECPALSTSSALKARSACASFTHFPRSAFSGSLLLPPSFSCRLPWDFDFLRCGLPMKSLRAVLFAWSVSCLFLRPQKEPLQSAGRADVGTCVRVLDSRPVPSCPVPSWPSGEMKRASTREKHEESEQKEVEAQTQPRTKPTRGSVLGLRR